MPTLLSTRAITTAWAPLTMALCLALAGSATAETKPKNWNPPKVRIYAQVLSDKIMADHPELLSVTFHGVPPGMDKVYTMFAGSYPDRIGNPDDPDDVDVITKGITIVDPRWQRSDAVSKFVIQTPLRDRNGANLGLLVLAFKSAHPSAREERDDYLRALDIRDGLQAKIVSYDALFAAAS